MFTTKLLPPQLSLLFPPPLLLKPPSLSTISATYGPSLNKGFNPFNIPHQEPIPNHSFDENNFTRVFDIAALRVPALHCAVLERKLRGHLLNWPRVRNIGRVCGDEVEEELRDVVGKLREENGLVSLERRVFGKGEGDGERLTGVLYRDKVVREFEVRGYLSFRNLAKLSRPMKRGKGEEEGRRRGVGKNEVVLLEVVEEGGGGDDMSALLGEGFKGGRWKGSTRLLLLDERYADKAIDELPEAINVSINRLRCILMRFCLLK